MYKVHLSGCAAEPIGSYLKALGILRLVSSVDAGARAWWAGNEYLLESELDDSRIVQFFLNDYVPTPIIAPWNGGSGFYEKDNRTAIELIKEQSASRFKPYREAIASATEVMQRLGIRDKSEDKERFLEVLRAELDDCALEWLDCAVVLTQDGPKYPPLLGTGGNDGRLEFTNNFMQHLVDALITHRNDCEELLRSSLFGEIVHGLRRAPTGQFLPGSAGGANSVAGFAGGALVNPWDFVLLMEGAVVFAGSITRRLESSLPGMLSYPFSVRATTGGDTVSFTDTAGSRHELWVPLWERPTGIAELRSLFSEGRVRVGRGGRTAVDGVDFGRAIANLGIDRGIESFVRYGFLPRNGRAYFATPIERWVVKSRGSSRAKLLFELDGWLNRLRSAASSSNAPSAVRAAQQQLDNACLELCRRDTAHALQEVLIALGAVEKQLTASRRFAIESGISPVPKLKARWLRMADDASTEFALAASLASTNVRPFIIPLRTRRKDLWGDPSDPKLVWTSNVLEKNLLALQRRRLLEELSEIGTRGAATTVQRPVSLYHVSRFLLRAVDDERIEALIRGLACVSYNGPTHARRSPRVRPRSALFALLKIINDRPRVDNVRLPICADAINAALAGNALAASRHAVRRLRAAGLVVIANELNEAAATTRRIAAALVFPISAASRRQLVMSVIVPPGPPFGDRNEYAIT